MASEVDICNLALSHLGDDAVVADLESPSSVPEEHCARFYPIARDMLTESHTWTHATRTARLTPSAYRVDDWQFAHYQPDDCLRPVRLFPIGGAQRETKFEFQTEADEDGLPVLLSNLEEANLRFIMRATNPDRYSPLFVQALSLLLASMLAGPIIKGDAGMKIGREMWANYLVARSQAIMSDANKSEVEYDHSPTWIETRSGYSGLSGTGGDPLEYHPSGYTIS